MGSYFDRHSYSYGNIRGSPFRSSSPFLLSLPHPPYSRVVLVEQGDAAAFENLFVNLRPGPAPLFPLWRLARVMRPGTFSRSRGMTRRISVREILLRGMLLPLVGKIRGWQEGVMAKVPWSAIPWWRRVSRQNSERFILVERDSWLAENLMVSWPLLTLCTRPSLLRERRT